MSESRVIEVYECQSFTRSGGWQPHPDVPWGTKDPPEPCVARNEITLPNNEWLWASDWIFEKKAGVTDEEGWEYASRLSRFLVKNRPPKAEAHQWSTVRRRLWTRIMRREIGVRTADIPKAMQKIQAGLTSIHTARVRIEEIMKQAPAAAESEQMINLVQCVKKNINDVVSSLDQISAHQHKNGSPQTTASAAVKKLRNDVIKEEAAIDKALNPGKTSPTLNSSNRDFLKLQKAHSNNFAESRSVNPVGGVGLARTRTNGSPPRGGGSGGVSSSSALKRGATFAGPGNNSGAITGGGGFSSSGSSTGGQAGTFLSSTNMPTLNELNDSDFPRFDTRGASTTTGGGGGGGGGGSSSSNGGVKSGRADTFNPSLIQSSSHVAGVDSDQGLFVDRSKRELQIAEKFVAVDEATVMQEIIDERNVEINKVHTGLVQVNEMFVDLARLVKEQESEIEHIFDNADESHAKTKQALEHIVEADQLQKSGNCTIS